MFAHYIILILMTITATVYGHRLGSSCHADEDCNGEVKSSTCDLGKCVCLPHHVRYNATMCIPAALLGYSCLLNSQCEDKVQNSVCDKNTCRCKTGFVPFKRHACLTPAKLGEICYSDEHCELWDSDSKCDYIIRNVIGRCKCGGHTKRIGISCLGKMNPIPKAITLGLKCSDDDECKAADINSKCINNVCDCIPPKNATVKIPRCSALNPGCYPGTFRCKSTPECISWFFVCDGRQHCADNSDETGCEGPDCPALSFKCKSGKCVSRASICDGTADCPDADDEVGCLGEKSCPAHTLRCRGPTPRCLPEYELCNAVKSCSDGSDEQRSICRGKADSKRPRASGITNTPSCPFRCGNGKCRSSAVVCSGRDGCGDNSDEQHCTVCRCPSQ